MIDGVGHGWNRQYHDVQYPLWPRPRWETGPRRGRVRKPGTVCDVDGFATKGTLADMTEGDSMSEVDKIPTYNAVS